MPKYRVWVDESRAGGIDLEAENKEEAEKKAWKLMESVDWTDSEIEICHIEVLPDDATPYDD